MKKKEVYTVNELYNLGATKKEFYNVGFYYEIHPTIEVGKKQKMYTIVLSGGNLIRQFKTRKKAKEHVYNNFFKKKEKHYENIN